MTDTTEPADAAPEVDAVHGMFGLSYANYLVLHRTLLQSMPDAWQNRFVALINEYEHAFAHLSRPEAFDITPGTDCYVNELSDEQLTAVGIERHQVNDDDGEWVRDEYVEVRTGRDVEGHEHVVLPGTDTVPHYNRGRTYVEPRLA